MTVFRIVALIAVLSATPALAEPMQRGACAAVKGRGYTGGCAQFENKTIIADVPEAAFSDPGLACQSAHARAAELLKAQLRAADKARGNATSFCLDLTIRCAPCGQVQK